MLKYAEVMIAIRVVFGLDVGFDTRMVLQLARF